jgi:hypothetical protein
MEHIIVESIGRQAKGAQLLAMLLEEEHRLLQRGNPQSVAGIELMVQELVRQMASERAMVGRVLRRMGYTRVQELLPQLPDATREQCQQTLAALEDGEQKSARQSMMNMDLAQALLEQTRGLLARIQKDLIPKDTSVYTARGVWSSGRPRTGLVQGRL